jgi:hypothetical protein
MNYDFNRKAFRSLRSVPGLEPLAVIYGGCVLLELSLKQHLGLVQGVCNAGHDLPQLLHRTSLLQPKLSIPCLTLKTQLENQLNALFTQGRDGNPRPIPAQSYPYLRYLRHDSDWSKDASNDSQIVALRGLIDRIINLLQLHRISV